MGHGKVLVFILSEMGICWSVFSQGVIVSGFVLRQPQLPLPCKIRVDFGRFAKLWCFCGLP